MKLVSWNVNGLRSAISKKFLGFVGAYRPDVICLQETRLQAHQIPEDLSALSDYQMFWSHAQRKGYSGVAIFARTPPRSVELGFGGGLYADEGRTLVADFGDFLLLNGYFPNGGQGPERLEYKLRYYADVLTWLQARRAEGREVVVTGDLNTAHQERDLARPAENRNTSGFLEVERAWMDRYLSPEGGLTDTFRLFIQEGGHYSWWSPRQGARKNNVGWRIDYFLVSQGLVERVEAASILYTVLSSDHCPITLELR